MTDRQPRLLDPGPATGAMSDREQFAQHLIRQTGGIRSSDLGASLHIAFGNNCPCSTDVRCKWSMSEGERVGKQLKKRELAIKRKTGLWQSLVRPPEGPGELPPDF